MRPSVADNTVVEAPESTSMSCRSRPSSVATARRLSDRKPHTMQASQTFRGTPPFTSAT